MKLSYIILPEERLILERLEGVVTYEEAIFSMQKIWADGSFDETYNGLVDVRWAEYKLSGEESKHLARQMSKSDSISGGQWAILMGKPRETAISMLFFNELNSPRNFQIFSSIEAAAQSLNTTREIIDMVNSEQAHHFILED